MLLNVNQKHISYYEIFFKKYSTFFCPGHAGSL